MLPTTILRICVRAAALVLIPGCQSTHRSSGTHKALSAFPESKPLHTRDVIGRTEFLPGQLDNAYEIVVRYRPEFLQGRADGLTTSRTATAPVIYIDHVRQGEVAMLRSIPTAVIAEIRFYRRGDAQIEFGPRDAGSVIAVRTRR